MAEPKKKGRTMTPELNEKLAKAREKGLAVIRAKKEAKEQAKKELENKTMEIMNKSKLPKKNVKDEENDSYGSDYSTKARFEEPKKIKKESIAKYNGVKKIKKTKIVYLEDNSSSDEEEVIVKKKKNPVKPEIPTLEETNKNMIYNRYSYLY